MKTILIDLWGTLLANGFSFDGIINSLGHQHTHKEIINLCKEEGLFSKTVSSLTIWEGVLSRLGYEKEKAKEINDLWLDSAKRVNMFPGTREFLSNLRKEGHLLVLASAIDRDSFELLEKEFSFKDHFDHIKTSYTVGLNKSIAFYQKICDDLNQEPKQCIMIGDNIDADILPADKVGLSTILLSRFLLADQEKDLLPSKTRVCQTYEEVLEAISN
ncbi:MAG: HAD family hydrolase [Nanoarchaeota archaeon]|nr:HAD family hydrolase [Nanoarchaeota archaeon]